MIIRYHSTEDRPGAKHRQWDIERKSFEVFDRFGNEYRLMENNQGLEIMFVETSEGMTKGLAVLPDSGNVITVRPAP
jgi:hypothetical protein